MRLLYSMTAAVVLAALTLAACNSTDNSGNRTSGGAGSNSSGAVTPISNSPGHVAPADGVKRVTATELRDALEKGTAIVVDVRGAVSYQQNHIKGSISIPLDEVGTRVSELPRDKMIVTYCS
jgi:predicted small secreted protein